MPCRSDHLEPTAREEESRKVANFINFLYAKLDKDTPVWILQASIELYGNEERADELTANLCGMLHRMSKEQIKTIVYNPYNKTSRELATWWEYHQHADAVRERQEKEKEATKKAAADAIAKLTQLEYNALRKYILETAADDCKPQTIRYVAGETT